MPNEGDATNLNGNQQQTLVFSQSQPINVELHSDVKPQNVEDAHSNFENNTHERNENLPNRDVHSDSDVKGLT